MKLATGGKFDDVADVLFPLLVHATRRDDLALQRVVREMADDTGSEAFVRQQAAIIGRPDSRPGLAAIACPTLVLVGDSDELTPPDRSAEIAAAIAGARLVVIPHCGHMCALETPAAVTRALVEWRMGSG
jgi:pimeloyl-ACP methyl ester carboxylesterase